MKETIPKVAAEFSVDLVGFLSKKFFHCGDHRNVIMINRFYQEWIEQFKDEDYGNEEDTKEIQAL